MVATSFEEWAAGDARYTMVFACNSFHWLDPQLGFAKAAAVLDDGGSLAVVTTPVVVPDGASRFWWDVQDDWASVGSERLDPATQHPDRVADFTGPVRASGLFDDAVTGATGSTSPCLLRTTSRTCRPSPASNNSHVRPRRRSSTASGSESSGRVAPSPCTTSPSSRSLDSARGSSRVDHRVGVAMDDPPVAPLEAEDHRDAQDLVVQFGVPRVEHVGASRWRRCRRTCVARP